jgi:hypothetical protein
MRKLVLTDKGGWLTEVDPKALRREALALKAYIDSAPKQEEKLFQYRKRLLPLVEAALSGGVQFPFKGDKPYSSRWIGEGFEPELPPVLAELYYRFMNRIRGNSTCGLKDIKDYKPELVEKDGQCYEWVEFED